MKNFRLIAATMILAVMAAISASAQTRPATTPARPATTPQTTAPVNTGPVPDTKIAYINTGAFAADKGGITRYVNAVNSLEREFKPRTDELTNLGNRIQALADEIKRLSGTSVVDPKSIQTKQDEGERLQRDLKYKDDQLKADMAKRYEDVVGPISQDIGKALDQFATQRGITMIFDISKLAPAILTANSAMDVTQAFITEYNSRNPATAAAGTR